jgi:hypothetical protein
MKLKFFIIIVYFLITGFIPIKEQYSNQRDYFVNVKPDKEIKYALKVSNKKIIGLQFLVTIIKKNEFTLKLMNKNKQLIKSINCVLLPDTTRKYQMLRFIFDKPVILSENTVITLYSDAEFKIWYGQKESNDFFILDSTPIKGRIYLDFIKELDIKKIIYNIKYKFNNNIVFKNTYIILIILICIAIGWTYVKKK